MSDKQPETIAIQNNAAQHNQQLHTSNIQAVVGVGGMMMNRLWIDLDMAHNLI